MTHPTPPSRAAGAAAPEPIDGPISHLLYLHGFRSSPQSAKARQVGAWMAAHRPEVAWCCPQLPPSPAEAWALITSALDGWPRDARLGVIGSSLGGYYATAVAERLAPGARAVLLNPAVAPARDLARYIGEITAWHSDERLYFRAEYIDELRALEGDPLTAPSRYLAVVAQGDELLDWREMQARYASARLRVVEGSDHALSDFDDHLPAVLAHLGLA